MKTIPNSKSDKRAITKITMEAHEKLPTLARLIAEEKGLEDYDKLAAASTAIIEATTRRQRRAERRAQRKQVTE